MVCYILNISVYSSSSEHFSPVSSSTSSLSWKDIPLCLIAHKFHVFLTDTNTSFHATSLGL